MTDEPNAWDALLGELATQDLTVALYSEPQGCGDVLASAILRRGQSVTLDPGDRTVGSYGVLDATGTLLLWGEWSYPSGAFYYDWPVDWPVPFRAVKL